MPKKIIIAGAGLDGQPITITGLPGTPLEGQSKSVLAWGTPPEVGDLSAMGGRIAVFDQEITNPSAGKAIARADGKTTLDLRGVTSAQAITAMVDGVMAQIEVSAIEMLDGWSSGEGYWLAQDGDGRFAPTPGRRHRKIYVSGSSAAMTKAMIAAHAGVAESAVTGAWLVARPVYGGSESMAVTHDVYLLLAEALHGRNKESRSDWVRFERGYSYPLIRSNLGSGDCVRGESKRHPLVYEDWGSGPWPVISKIEWTTLGPQNIIIRNLRTPFYAIRNAANIITEGGYSEGTDYLQYNTSHSITLKDMVIKDHHKVTPKNGTTWNYSNDRVSGSYMSNVRNVLAIGNLVDRNGWEPGFNPDGVTWNNGQYKQPPSDRNHGLYWTHNCRNLTLRENILSRNSLSGIQIRCGGHFERNLFLENNLAASIGGSDKDDANAIYFAQFVAFLDNVGFGAGYKIAVNSGDKAKGYDITNRKASLIGNALLHRANPDDQAEKDSRPATNVAAYSLQPDSTSKVGDIMYNDTQIVSWNSLPDENVAGISATIKNQTTIQRYAAQLLSNPSATIDDLIAHAIQESVSVPTLVQDIIRWTKARLNTPLPAVRTAPATLTFLPDWRTEGFRWDNRRNWSSFDLPGTHIADSVDLDGNFVRFGTLTASVAALASKGGILDVVSGGLTLGAITDAAAIRVRGSGTMVIPATTQPLDVAADSGLTQVTGAVASLNLEVRGDAEVLLGPDCTVPAGKSLVISGQRPLVGWDGTGNAILTVAGTLEFRVGMMCTTNIDTSTDLPKGTGQMLQGNDVVGTNFRATLADFECMSSSNNNRLYLSDITGLPVAGESYKFGVGQPNAEKIDLFLQVTAIASRGLSMLQRFRSGTIGDGLTDPTVTATVTLVAGSQVVIGRRDLLLPGTYDLTGPGVTVTNQGATLPEGVTVTGGKLVLVV